MSDENKLPAGSVAWIDLTVSDALGVRDFYKEVVGWDSDNCKMDGYEDYNMMPGGTQQAVAGICHARGSNTGMPANWMIYITVPDVEAAAAKCKQRGGKVLLGPQGEQARFCVIEDPAGAVCALWESK
jgi:predicted enzyme related to lactoylglutathione lyase